MRRPQRPVLEKLMSVRTLDPAGCWLWGGYKDRDGYGRVWIDSPVSRRGYVHRVAYELLVGAIPEGLSVDHLCRVRHCFNPEHLEPVTQRENVMRSGNHIARNVAKTECPRGHPYDEANTRYRPLRNGSVGRTCRECTRIRLRAAWKKRAES